MISALKAVEAIHQQRGDALAVAIMTPNRYLEQVSDRPYLDLPIIGGMGKASSVGLGLALAQPKRRVLILDGDGSLLMNLGVLVTIAGQQPQNLVHFVFEDGVYFTTGGQPLPGSGIFDLAAIARGAGYKEGLVFDDLEDFVSDLPRILSATGPVFVCLRVHHEGGDPGPHVGSTRIAMKCMMKSL